MQNTNNTPTLITKISIKDLHLIRELYKTNKYTQRQLGERFKVSRQTINNIINNQYYRYNDVYDEYGEFRKY